MVLRSVSEVCRLVEAGLFLSLNKGVLPEIRCFQKCVKTFACNSLIFSVTFNVPLSQGINIQMYNIQVETNEIFSSNLTRLRKQKGLSQRELGRITEISHRMINHYENNPTSVPINKIKTISDALNIKISDLFDEENNEDFLENLDIRWIKKIKELKDLPEADRKEINRHINSLLEKQKLKNQQEKKIING